MMFKFVPSESATHAKKNKKAIHWTIFLLPYLSTRIPAGIANTILPISVDSEISVHCEVVACTSEPIIKKYMAFGSHPSAQPITNTIIYTGNFHINRISFNFADIVKSHQNLPGNKAMICLHTASTGTLFMLLNFCRYWFQVRTTKCELLKVIFVRILLIFTTI